MASAKVIDQKEYLKRYLSGKDKGGKKKRKRSKTVAGRGLSIVDDNMVAATVDVEEEETNLYELAENAPAVAGIYDDRPIHVQARETFGAKWKSLAPDEPEEVVAPDTREDSDDVSPPRKKTSKRRQDSDSDASPPRRKATPDFSPPRRKSKSPDRRNSGRGSSRRSASPPRRRTNDSRGRRDSPKRHRRRSNSRSPPRKSRDSSPPRRSDSRRKSRSPPPKSSRVVDLSPPRRSNNRRAKSSDSDISPPRNKPDQKRRPRQNSDSDLSPPRLDIKIKEEPVDSDEDGCTLEGKKAGLQDARSVKAELLKLRKKEHEHFQKMDDRVSGRGAQAVYRDRKSGRRRDLEQEEKQSAEEKEEERKKKEEFAKLGRGLVQLEQQKARAEEAMHEMSKPVARYAGDQDLEQHLRAQEREGDPMLDYLRAKRRRENPGEDKPAYQGPSGPPNRFNINPGHRWDGVDRSTGYEKKLFASQNAKLALQDEAYKWSVADM